MSKRKTPTQPPLPFPATELWVVLMHQRTVFGPFPNESLARAWAGVQLQTYHCPAPAGEVHFGSVSVMKLISPLAPVTP